MLLPVLEAGKYKVKATANSVSGEGLLPGSHTDSCLVAGSSHGRRDRELFGVSYRGTNSIDPITPKATPP